ncbi:MAG: hypothetical protein AAFO82_14325 [Bacteroidota bacterium]
MELEEMQTLWSEMSDQIEKKQTLSKSEIMEMTQQQYQKKLNKIAYPEIIGSIICFGMVILIFFNLNQLDDTLSLLSALVSLVILLFLPIASLSATRRLQTIDLSKNSYQQTLLTYTKAKKQLCQVQKTGLYLSFVLMFTIIPVFKTIMGKELEIKSLLTTLPFGILFMILFVAFVSRYYGNSIRETEVLIKDIEDQG